MLGAMQDILSTTAQLLMMPRVNTFVPSSDDDSTALRSATRPAAQTDSVQISASAREAIEAEPTQVTASEKSSDATAQDLSPEEKQQVDELKTRDREVRRHEQAHKAAAGQYGGSVSYSYTTGPDGKRYASGGSVAIDSSPVEGDPRATIQKMRQVQRAANAPADPSAQDRSIATRAARELQRAQSELTREKSETTSNQPGQVVDALA